MLRLILILILVTGVTHSLKGEDDLSDCLKITHFSTVVDFEEVSGKWISVYSSRYKDPDKCREITITPASKEDVKSIKTRCNGTTPKSFPFRQTVGFNWDQTIKKVSFSNTLNDTIISKMNDTYKVLLDCDMFIYIECRKYRDNLVLFAWNDAGKGHPEFIQLAEDEPSRCLVDDKLTEIGYPLLPQYSHKYEFCHLHNE
ncbi:hypothetical protein O0L34_g13875 [Tuta absoluta]|nr:hypothetical protein O0L34_g13875 [Tuta absoluta]